MGLINVTCDSSIALKYLFYVRLGHLEGVQVPDKDPGVDRLRILRTRLVPNLAKAHRQATLVTVPEHLEYLLVLFVLLASTDELDLRPLRVTKLIQLTLLLSLTLTLSLPIPHTLFQSMNKLLQLDKQIPGCY